MLDVVEGYDWSNKIRASRNNLIQSADNDSFERSCGKDAPRPIGAGLTPLRTLFRIRLDGR